MSERTPSHEATTLEIWKNMADVNMRDLEETRFNPVKIKHIVAVQSGYDITGAITPTSTCPICLDNYDGCDGCPLHLEIGKIYAYSYCEERIKLNYIFDHFAVRPYQMWNDMICRGMLPEAKEAAEKLVDELENGKSWWFVKTDKFNGWFQDIYTFIDLTPWKDGVNYD